MNVFKGLAAKYSITKIAVITFLIFALWGLSVMVNSGKAHAEPVVSLGTTVFNSSSTTGEFSYLIPDSQWEVGVLAIGDGDTKRGHQSVHYGASASYLVEPVNWPVYFRIGVAYIEDENPLIGDTNFRLGIGHDFRLFRLEMVHFSSAGIHDPNTGVDAIQLRVPLPSL